MKRRLTLCAAYLLLGLPVAEPSGARPGPSVEAARTDTTTYVCPPCAPHDTLRFEADGHCPVCGMALIQEVDSSRVGHAHLEAGSGNFVVRGGPGHEDGLVTVFYHAPGNYAHDSPVLLVIPGAGRNAWDYRDAWVEASEQHGILILSPSYTEQEYGFEDYHMGGLVEETNLTEVAEFVENSSQVLLDEERLVVDVNPSESKWIFGDFDRIVQVAKEAAGSTRSGYDVFGHSAGGQILHRQVLLHPESEADRIVAANAGFYTMPDLEAELPFGLKGAPVREEDLRASFARNLVLLLGEEDDHPEAGGIFLRSPSADRQGAGRLQRGRHFYEASRARAEEIGAEFDWEIETVPGVGHEFGRMSEAAAEYLYGDGGSSYRERVREARRERARRLAAADVLPEAAGEESPVLRHFRVDSAYRFVARLERLARPDTVYVPSSTGAVVPAGKVGHVRIDFPTGPERLSVFRAGGADGSLWIPFADATNGKETYPAGRYVGVRSAGEEGKTVVVDFNRAHNPTCEYDPRYTCPLPPEENHVSFRVPAGEKRMSHEGRTGK